MMTSLADRFTGKAKAPTSSVRPDLRAELGIAIVFIVASTVVSVAVGNVYWQQIILLALIYVIAASGLSVLDALAKQISFGQGAVVGVSAYSMALASGVWMLPFWVSVIIGLVCGMTVGMLVALPSLRVQGYYLGFVTMAAAIALPELLLLFKDQTHALTGVNVFDVPLSQRIFGALDWLTVVIMVLAVGAVLLIAVLRSSKFGRQLLLAGTSPEAASTLGLRPGRLRLQAFGIAAVTGSVAGVLYVCLIKYVAPSSFMLSLSILLFFIVVIGGPGSIAGTVLGVAVLYIVPDVMLANFVDYRLLIYGVIAFAVMFWMPDGLAGGAKRLLHLARRHPTALPEGLTSLEPIIAAAAQEVVVKPTGGQPVLSVSGVSRKFNAVVALDDVGFDIQPGEIHAIVGPNGSGKTTMLNAISGLISLDSGTIRIDGVDVTSKSASRRARMGLGRTFQQPRILDSLSAWENVDLGPTRLADGSRAWLNRVLSEFRDRWDAIAAGTLPHGQRRSLEVIRAMRAEPSLLALDEPAAGLSHAERDQFGRLLRQISESTGAAILMVEHDLELVWGTADRITVLDRGRVVVTGMPADVRVHPDVAKLFVGVGNAED